MKIFALVLGASLCTTPLAFAEPNGHGNGRSEYVLKDGTVHSTPGEMFQYLRERDNGLASGNPKDIVNAYPDEFENVGDLIHQKRVD